MKEVDKVYKKVDGKFVEVGFEWAGFPMDGVWLVKDGSQNCIMKMDDIGKKPIPYINIMKHKEDIMEDVYKLTSKPHSTNDLVDCVLNYIAGEIEYERYI